MIAARNSIKIVLIFPLSDRISVGRNATDRRIIATAKYDSLRGQLETE